MEALHVVRGYILVAVIIFVCWGGSSSIVYGWSGGQGIPCRLWGCQGNMFEGSIPSRAVPIGVQILDAGGGPSGGLRGILPSKVGRLEECGCLALQHHHLEGVIPYIRATMEMLALHDNDFNIFLGTHLSGKSMFFMKETTICLFNNHLSCLLPAHSNDGAIVGMSLTALGNQLLLQGEFPSWVTPMEHDKVFWTSSKEGRSLFVKMVFAGITLGCALAVEFRGGRWAASERAASIT